MQSWSWRDPAAAALPSADERQRVHTLLEARTTHFSADEREKLLAPLK